ncbi:uncharacterized protein [Leptinotarsa decemlineata]|uniref:uncharacterized protein n=1 Tax=Leptinotarsa decemlineata TaxID=7539 RepID=UPI003D304975
MSRDDEMDIRFEAGFTLQEALDMVYLDNIEEIFIEPPDSNALSDEDSATEDDGGTLDNLSGRQLQSKVEIKFANSTERLTSKNHTNDLVTSDNTALHNGNISLPEKVKPKDKIIWEENADIVVFRSRIFPVQNYNMFLEKSPVEIFEMFIDDNRIICERNSEGFTIQELSRSSSHFRRNGNIHSHIDIEWS